MIPGVTFQPGQSPSGGPMRPGGTAPGKDSGLQEAIKVLSLRLPRVVGAQAVAPQSLLTGPGGQGRVDSVVQAVLQKVMPTGPAANSAPVLGPDPGENSTMPPTAPNFTGTAYSPTTPLSDLMRGPTADQNRSQVGPRITVDSPTAPPALADVPTPPSQFGPTDSASTPPAAEWTPDLGPQGLIDFLRKKSQENSYTPQDATPSI